MPLSSLKLNLTDCEKRVYRIHTAYSILEGVIAGVLALNEFVFIKSLHGSSYQLSVLFQFSVLVFLVLLVFNEMLKRVKSKVKLLRITGALTRLPLFVLVFFPGTHAAMSGNSVFHYIFLAVFLVYYLGNPAIFPVINLLLKHNYRHEVFGKLYSFATFWNKVVMLLTTFVYGLLLDADNFAFRWVFPVIAVMGFVSLVLLSRIHYEEKESFVPVKKFFASILESGTNMYKTWSGNKAFKHFEVGFLFYGFAFMSTITVITLFFERSLHLNYSGVAFYKNAYNVLALLWIPFFGRLLGRIDPRKFAAITFATILLYLLSLALTSWFPDYVEVLGIKIYYFLLLYILGQSLFAATMSLLWSIGSAYFCKPDEAADYQSVHLFLTGTRAVFAPILGVLFYEMYGFEFTFMVGATFALIAVLVMIWSYRRDIGTTREFQLLKTNE
ncbi:MAG: MFS transporter [Bacteroidales bacterium]